MWAKNCTVWTWSMSAVAVLPWQLQIIYILIVGLDGSQLTLGLRKEEHVNNRHPSPHRPVRPTVHLGNSLPRRDARRAVWLPNISIKAFRNCWSSDGLSPEHRFCPALLDKAEGRTNRPLPSFLCCHPTVANPPTTWREVRSQLGMLGDAVFCRAQGAFLLQSDERSGRVSWSGDQPQTSWVPRKFTKPVVIWRFPNMRVTPRIIHVSRIFHEINH